MSSREQIVSAHQMAGTVFRIWSDYFMKVSGVIPPLTFVKEGANGDEFFATGATEEVVADFLKFVSENPDYSFVRIGDWIVSPYEWFGHWSFFCASKRRSMNFIWDSEKSTSSDDFPKEVKN